MFEIYRNVWEVLKSPNIVNLHQEMTMLELKINVNLPQLLCIVISAAENGEFERFGGFSVDCYYTLSIVTVNGKPTKSLKFAIFSRRNDNTQQLR